jgi:hypothetical protein
VKVHRALLCLAGLILWVQISGQEALAQGTFSQGEKDFLKIA